jgi:hypothetical protein
MLLKILFIKLPRSPIIYLQILWEKKQDYNISSINHASAYK